MKKHLYRAEASQLLGDIYWLQEKPEEALSAYTETALLTPRETVEQNLIKRVAALSDSYTSDSRNRLRRILISEHS